MKYFKVTKKVTTEGKVQYGNLPIDFTVGYESDTEVVFPLDDSVVIPMKLKDLATFIGTTPETLSRKLKLLEQKKIIKKNHKQIRILDVDALEDV